LVAEWLAMTGPIVVAGVANVQQIVPVDSFPVSYTPVRYLPHRLRLEAGGVGLNVARSLRVLGSAVRMAAFVGPDPAGVIVRAELERAELLGPGLVETSGTPTSAVLIDPGGARQVHTDLKDLPESRYPPELFAEILAGAQLAVVSTVGFARPLLDIATAAGVPVAADVQTVTGLDDTYDQPWLEAANVLFCSAERLESDPVAFARAALDRFPVRIVVVGLGADGAQLAVRDQPIRRLPAVAPHGVVDTTGAGDALFAGFLHSLLATDDPEAALARAVVVAGCTVGTTGTRPHFDEAHIATLLAPAR
jgi:sugar/nucleoside kinase (ribokinase family)